jgi:hypothetical protein
MFLEKAKAPDFLGGNRGLCGNQEAPEGLPMFFIGKARIGFPNYWFKRFRPRNQLKALLATLSGALKEGPQWDLKTIPH